jgi:hypothetical protein
MSVDDITVHSGYPVHNDGAQTQRFTAEASAALVQVDGSDVQWKVGAGMHQEVSNVSITRPSGHLPASSTTTRGPASSRAQSSTHTSPEAQVVAQLVKLASLAPASATPAAASAGDDAPSREMPELLPELPEPEAAPLELVAPLEPLLFDPLEPLPDEPLEPPICVALPDELPELPEPSGPVEEHAATASAEATHEAQQNECTRPIGDKDTRARTSLLSAHALPQLATYDSRVDRTFGYVR